MVAVKRFFKGFGKLTEHQYKSQSLAEKKARAMKKKYGYRPEVFKVTGKGKKRFVVVEPSGLKKI